MRRMNKKRLTDEELLREIIVREAELGRKPRKKDVKRNQTIIYRFGTWKNALVLARHFKELEEKMSRMKFVAVFRKMEFIGSEELANAFVAHHKVNVVGFTPFTVKET